MRIPSSPPLEPTLHPFCQVARKDFLGPWPAPHLSAAALTKQNTDVKRCEVPEEC